MSFLYPLSLVSDICIAGFFFIGTRSHDPGWHPGVRDGRAQPTRMHGHHDGPDSAHAEKSESTQGRGGICLLILCRSQCYPLVLLQELTFMLIKQHCTLKRQILGCSLTPLFRVSVCFTSGFETKRSSSLDEISSWQTRKYISPIKYPSLLSQAYY